MPKFSSFFSKAALRKGVFFIHLWLGLFVGAYFVVAGITGSILVFQNDIEVHFLMPERTAVTPPTPTAKLMPLSEIITGLREKFPEATDINFALITPPENKGGAYLFRLPDKGISYSTTVNPYTGEVMRQALANDSWLSWVDDLHVNLLKKAPGKIANGYLGLLSGIILLSGIWLWWPATWRQLKLRSTIKKGAPFHRIVSDLHNIFGIYPFLLLLVVTLTGSVIIFYKPIQKVVVSFAGKPKNQRPPIVSPPTNMHRMPIEQLLPAADKIMPQSSYVFILFPLKPNQALQCYKRSPVGILPDTRIFINPYDGKVLRVENEIDDPLTTKIMRSASGIHFGRWGYLGVKVLYALLGLLPLGLFITGVLMYIRKRQAKIQHNKRKRLKNNAQRERRIDHS